MGTEAASEILCVIMNALMVYVQYSTVQYSTVHLLCECHLYIFIPFRATDIHLNMQSWGILDPSIPEWQ